MPPGTADGGAATGSGIVTCHARRPSDMRKAVSSSGPVKPAAGTIRRGPAGKTGQAGACCRHPRFIRASLAVHQRFRRAGRELPLHAAIGRADAEQHLPRLPGSALLYDRCQVHQPGGGLQAQLVQAGSHLDGPGRGGPPDVAGPVVIAGQPAVHGEQDRAAGHSHGRRIAPARPGVSGRACPADPPAGQVHHLKRVHPTEYGQAAISGGIGPVHARGNRPRPADPPARRVQAGEHRAVGEHDDQALPPPHARNALTRSVPAKIPGPHLVPVGQAQPVKDIPLREYGDPADRKRRHPARSERGQRQRHLPAHPARRRHVEGIRIRGKRARRAVPTAAAGQPGEGAGAGENDRAGTAHRHHALWTHPGGSRVASS